MSIKISGKQMDIGENLTEQIETRINEIVEKYFGRGYSGNVVIEKQKSGFTTDCQIYLDSGMRLQTSAIEKNAIASFDKAFERIEKRLRRYTRKLKNHTSENNVTEEWSAPYKVMAAQSANDLEEDLAPAIIAESSRYIPKMVVASAVMQLELMDEPILVFKNASDGRINVVYWRKDGNIGWIDTNTDTTTDVAT